MPDAIDHPVLDHPALDLDRLGALARRLDRDAAAGLIPGAQLVVGRRGGIAYEAAVGWRDATAPDPAARDPLRADAVWRIFSMTKPIVSAAAMVLVERGDLRLDGPVAELIPAFADLRVAAPGGGTPAATVPAAAAPTVQDLMRHTAGLAYGYMEGGPAGRAIALDGFLGQDLSLAEHVDRLAGFPLEFEPGTVWHYSHATDVLGRAVEVATGLSLGEALRALLLGPLGMVDTGFRLPERDRARVAEPLPQAPGARPHFFDPCAPRRRESGGGGLVSTAADYARFCRMVLGRGTLDGARVLGPASVALMTADHLGQGACGQGIGRAAWYPPGPGYGFGLGFAVRTAAGEAPFPGTVGDLHWNGVGGTCFWIDPARDFFAVLMLQSASADQRQRYRTLARGMVYAALG